MHGREIINDRGIHDIWVIKTCLITKRITELGFNKGWESEAVKKEKWKAFRSLMIRVNGLESTSIS